LSHDKSFLGERKDLGKYLFVDANLEDFKMFEVVGG
jgi:hypothetical protein